MNKTVLINTEEIQNYIKDIRKIKVVSHERQNEIFELLRDKKITKHERDKLLNEHVLGNLRYVSYMGLQEFKKKDDFIKHTERRKTICKIKLQ